MTTLSLSIRAFDMVEVALTNVSPAGMHFLSHSIAAFTAPDLTGSQQSLPRHTRQLGSGQPIHACAVVPNIRNVVQS
eukprot:CAMPEP_0170088914 /NCGR_PEP_ID=MMETSP0019_2-20121128/23094_1 /TAXON_ID=98059 /ORGANISM="Dinobryon sp., Strain UTEXLB2267" /LENGTH=76 /DNA_ID=CAMNT_0010307445 /DNA_START=178 /DNA_END=405 /DNA_ORIENTATION=+